VSGKQLERRRTAAKADATCSRSALAFSACSTGGCFASRHADFRDLRTDQAGPPPVGGFVFPTRSELKIARFCAPNGG
jgi:hypothetical protein